MKGWVGYIRSAHTGRQAEGVTMGLTTDSEGERGDGGSVNYVKNVAQSCASMDALNTTRYRSQKKVLQVTSVRLTSHYL